MQQLSSSPYTALDTGVDSRARRERSSSLSEAEEQPKKARATLAEDPQPQVHLA